MGGSSKVTVGYKYHIGMHMVPCHGPVDKLVKIVVDSKTAWEGESTGGSITIDQEELFGGEDREGGITGSVDVLMGEATQTKNSYLQSVLGSLIPAYRGVCSLVLKQVYVGINPYLKAWSPWFERIHVRQNGIVQWYDEAAAIGNDMNPAHIIREVLTDPNWGMGYPESEMDDDSFTAAADLFVEEEMGMSILWDKSISIDEFLQQILKHIEASLFVSRETGKFVLNPTRGDYVIADLPVYNESNVSKVTNYKKGTVSELINTVTAIFWNMETGENDSITVQDPDLITKHGGTNTTTKQYPGFTNGTITSKVASRVLKSLSTPLTSVTLTVTRSASSLNVGDVFLFSWDKYNVANLVMRVTNIEFGTLESNGIKITCVEDVFSIGNATYAAPVASAWVNPVTIPAPSLYHSLQESTYWDLTRHLGEAEAEALDSYDTYILATCVRPSGDSISCSLYSDPTDSNNYVDRNTTYFCPSCLTTSELGPKDTVIPYESAVDMDLIEAGTYCILNDEYLVVVSVDEALNQVTVKRGTLDTVPSTNDRLVHPAGSRIYFVEDFQESDQYLYVLGNDVSVKLTPRTGQGELDVGSAVAQELTIVGRQNKPYPPQNFLINGENYPDSVIGTFPINWVHRDRLQQTVELLGTLDDSVGPEDGVLYTMQVVNLTDLTGLRNTTAISGSSVQVSQMDYSGPIGVRLFSYRDSTASHQAHYHKLAYIPYEMTNTATNLPDTVIEINTDLTVNFTADPGLAPYTWSIDSGAIPTGMSLDPANGLISGPPNADGVYTFGLGVSDSQGFTGVESYTIEVTSLPTILGEIIDGELQVAYSFEPWVINTGPSPVWSITSGTLPLGLTLDSATGEISGEVDRTAKKGTYTVTLDATGTATATRVYSFEIDGWAGNYITRTHDGTRFISTITISEFAGGSGNQNTVIAASPDSIDWTINEDEALGFAVKGVVTGLGYYVAFGGNSSWVGIASTWDGEWDSELLTGFPVAGIGGSVQLSCLLFNGTEFVIGGEDGIIITRTPATEWTEIPVHAMQNSANQIMDMDYNGTLYYAAVREVLDPDGDPPDLMQVWKGTDLSTWTKVYEITDGDHTINRVRFLNGDIFIVGYQTISTKVRPWIMVSTDAGVTWTDVSPSISLAVTYGVTCTDMAYFNGTYIALGLNAEHYCTVLGTWTTSLSVGLDLTDPVSDGTTLLVTDRTNPIYETRATTDGVNWYYQVI